MTPRFAFRLLPFVVGACLSWVSRGAWAAPPDAPGDSDRAPEDVPPPADDAGWGLPSAPADDPPADDPAPPAPSAPPAESPRPARIQAAEPLAALPDAPKDEDEAFTAPRGQLGISVGVPFYDESIVHGDMTVDVRYGRKFWWLVPAVSVGFRQARLDPGQVPDLARRKKLEAWHTTLGLRLEIPTSARFFPFIGISGELSTWSFTADTTDFCQDAFYPDAWRCYRRQDWKTGWAVKPQVGFVFKPEPSLALEFWVERGTVFAPDTFTRSVTFINPALGFTWHH